MKSGLKSFSLQIMLHLECNGASFSFLDNGASQLKSDTLPKALVAFDEHQKSEI